MKKLLIGGVILTSLAIIGVGVAYLWYDNLMTAPIGDEKAVEITLEDGATYDHAAEVLGYHGLNPHPLLFDVRSRQRGRRVPLKAGIYQLDLAMSPDKVMDALIKGPAMPLGAKHGKLQIIEGHNIFQVAARLEALHVTEPLLTKARDPQYVRKLKLPIPRRGRAGVHTLLEGYLFPDTYYLALKKPTLASAVNRATRRFREVFGDLKVEHARSYARLMKEHGFSDHDFVILASLIEKEVRVASEAPRVAAVFYNRLAKGQPLQTDPTLVYAPDKYKEVPAPRHRRDRTNPYNTYAHAGLPPGPIANPGRNALRAALAPSDSKDLYFVAMRDGTGRHAFARTMRQHQANIDRYLKR